MRRRFGPWAILFWPLLPVFFLVGPLLMPLVAGLAVFWLIILIAAGICKAVGTPGPRRNGR